MGKFAKSFDIFGKPLSLKFDKKWNTHDTKFGGFSTLTLIIFIIIYTSVCINVMLSYGQDTIKNIYLKLNLNDLGKTNYNDTNVLIFASLYGNMLNFSQNIQDVN